MELFKSLEALERDMPMLGFKLEEKQNYDKHIKTISSNAQKRVYSRDDMTIKLYVQGWFIMYKSRYGHLESRITESVGEIYAMPIEDFKKETK